MSSPVARGADGQATARKDRRWRGVLIVLMAPLLAALLLQRWPALVAFAVVFWVLISLPIAILVGLDRYRKSRTEAEASGVGRSLLRLPILLVGYTAGAIGLALLGWVLYKVLWERQYELQAFEAILTAVGITGFGVYCIRLGLTGGPIEEEEPAVLDGGPAPLAEGAQVAYSERRFEEAVVQDRERFGPRSNT